MYSIERKRVLYRSVPPFALGFWVFLLFFSSICITPGTKRQYQHTSRKEKKIKNKDTLYCKQIKQGPINKQTQDAFFFSFFHHDFSFSRSARTMIQKKKAALPRPQRFRQCSHHLTNPPCPGLDTVSVALPRGCPHSSGGYGFKRAEFKRIAGSREVEMALHTTLVNRTPFSLDRTPSPPPHNCRPVRNLSVLRAVCCCTAASSMLSLWTPCIYL